MVNLKDYLIAGGASGFADLTLAPHAISDDGRFIVGNAVNVNGVSQAFIAAIPEPSSLRLAALALLSVPVCAWRRFVRLPAAKCVRERARPAGDSCS
jgi:hypothetical protein